MKKLFELGAICIWWNIWQSCGSHGPCLHYPILISSALCSPTEPPHGGAFCPWGFSDGGQYVPKVRSTGGKPHARRSSNDYLIRLFTLDLRKERGTKWRLLAICSTQGKESGEDDGRGGSVSWRMEEEGPEQKKRHEKETWEEKEREEVWREGRNKRWMTEY